jgi:Bacterial Ig-like domain (group 1)
MRPLVRLSAFLLPFPLLVAACDGDGPAAPRAGPPVRIEIVSGDGQEGTVGRRLPDPLVVRVLDDGGLPVPGVVVHFAVTAGGGSLQADADTTDAGGLARDRWTLGTGADAAQRVEARVVSGAAALTKAFAARAVAAGAGRMAAVGASERTGTAGDPLPEPLAVRVADRYGNPVAGVTVAWAVRAGGGTVTSRGGATDSDGVARADWTLGPWVGPWQVVRAIVGDDSASFRAAPAVPSTATIEVVSGGGQTGEVGRLLADSLVVRVRHADGRPLEKAVVAWPADTGAGTLSGHVRTRADGRAAAAWRLPRRPGEVEVSVLLPGTAARAAASATVLRGPPARVIAIPYAGPWLYAGDTAQVAAKVTDRYGNVIPGQEVRWSTATGVAFPATSVTDADGVARARWSETRSGERRLDPSVSGAVATWWRLTWLPGPVTEIRFAPRQDTLQAGGGTEFTAVALDRFENRHKPEWNADRLQVWSGDESVVRASVYEAHWTAWIVWVDAIGPGTTQIYARHVPSGFVGSIPIVVVPPSP